MTKRPRRVRKRSTFRNKDSKQVAAMIKHRVAHPSKFPAASKR